MSSTPQKGHESGSLKSGKNLFLFGFMQNSRNLQIFWLMLVALIFFFVHAPHSYAGKWVSGYLAGKGLVLGPSKKPVWVEYDKNGKIVREIGEANESPLKDAVAVSADICRYYIEQFKNARQNRENSTTVVTSDIYASSTFEYNAGTANVPSWRSVEKPSLKPDTNTVIVTKREFLSNSKAGLVVLESPLSMTTLTSSNIPLTTRSVLLSKKGEIIATADVNIGYKSAFYGKENGEVTNTGLTSLYGYKPGTDKLWGPISGAQVAVMADSPTMTEPSGRYAASLSYISTCPGYSWSYDLNIYATLRYMYFNPRSRNSSGIFMVGRPFYYYCSEMAQSMLAIPNFNAQMAGIAMQSMESQINKYWYPGNDIPVDVANLSGLALMSNRTMGAPENPVAKLPMGRTLYSYQNHNQAPSDPVPGSHEIPVNIDFVDRGLLQSISKADLLDTDIYLYRESNDQAITYQEGLIPYEISNEENTDINYRIFMRGPASFVFMKQKELIPWQKANNVNPELHGASADDIRVGENIKVVMVNRKTGYMGTGTANLGAAGGRIGDLISFIASTIELRPPNLKIWAEREPDVSKWTDNRDNPDSSRYNRPYVIGSQGAGLTNDSKIIIYTDWTDQDGTPLPSALPGFTGRLAKVVKADGGSELNEISNFEIKPGRKMQVLRFSEDQDNTHFYVHVSGQPSDRNPDFSGSAADSGPLASRPANYVPIRVPMYDKASSPNDPREPAVYRYIFRPEYTFSLYRSVLPVKPPKPADPGKPEITETSPEDRPASGSDTNQNPENNREALEAVLGAYGLNYLLTTDKTNPLPILDSAPGSLVFGNGTDSETTAVIDSNGRVIIGSAQTLSALTPEDYFALKLYSNGDEGNVLWQIETPVISNIELMDEHNKKILNAPMGVSVSAKAMTHPKNRDVLWSVEGHQDGVSATINAYTGSIYVLENSKSGWIKLRATDKQRPNVFKEVIIHVGCSSCSSGTCGNQPGVSFVELSGLNIIFCAGPAPKTDGEGFIGELYIRSNKMSPEVGTSRALGFSTMYEEAKAVYDKTGAVRQVVTPKSFMDIVTLNDSSYEVRVYENTAKGAWNGKEYKINDGAELLNVWKIEYKESTLSLTSSTETWVYKYNDVKREWILEKPDGSKEKEIETPGSNGERTVRREKIAKKSGRSGKSDSDGDESVSVTETVYKKIDGFESAIKEITDPDGVRITTNTEYDTAEGASGLGKPKKILNHDGSWTRYEYDSSGRKIKEIRPYLSAGPDAADGSSLVTEYDHAPLSGDSNLSADKESPRTITEKTLGVVTSKSYHVYILMQDGFKKEITERCSGSQGEGIKPFGDASNQRTVNIYYPATASKLERGRLKTSERSDGRVTTYSYAYGRFTKASDPANSKFVAGLGTDVQETVVTGTKNLPEGVTNKTTMENRITDSLGYAQMEETRVFSGTGYEKISWKAHEYDDQGREIASISSDGTKTSKTWSCCGLEKETSPEGIVTRFTLDALKRISSKETEGISGPVRTSYVYDTAGRKVSETVTAGDISMISSTKYDGAGRVVSSKDASGLETIYAYSPDGRTTTVTRPGGATEITERYPDGKTKSVTGTGVTAQYFEYGVDAYGSSWTISRIGSPDSPMYENTVYDISGRTIRTEKPGPKGVEVTKNYYDSNGRLVKTETPGMASTLYVYNELGETIRTGLDVDGNGILEPASQDRITESETQFKKIGSDWWQESVSRIYAEDNSATPKNTGLSRSRLTGLGSANLTAESESFDINGNKSSSKTFTDAAGKTVTNQVLVGRAELAKPDTSVSRFGLMVSNTDSAGVEVKFEYDALGRRIKTVDPRTGASITHFDSKGRVDFVTDAAGNKTEFGYDETTGRKIWEKNASGKFTRYAYDVKGRISKTWGDSVYPVAYSYDETGRMVSMTTYRADKGWSGESFPENATGDTTKWHYDPATGLLLAKEYADGTKTEYKYAEAGRLDSRIWARKNGANAVSTSYVYDPSTASLNKIDYSDETADITFAYDRIGRQKSITDAVGTRIFAYNDSLQLQSEKIDGLTQATITRIYEADGVKGRPKGFAVEKTGDARYEISYGYDPSGRIKTLSWNAGGKADTATYDYVENSHLLSSMKTGSGLTTSYTYEDHRNVKTAVSNSFGNTAVSTYTYEYDELGRRKSVKNSGSAFNNPNFNIYGYNDRSEVTASNSFTGEDLANKNNPLEDRNRAYNYDPIGNRKSANVGCVPSFARTDGKADSCVEFSYISNSLNQYESISGGANPETPAYDADGNMTVSKGMVYTYNAENRLIEASPQNPQQGSAKSTYIYDYMGRRAQKTLYTYSSGSWQKQKDISFIYDGWNMVKESEKTSDSSPYITVYYVWGLDLSQSMQGAGGVGGLIASVKSGNEYLYSYDANGNVGQMVKASDGSIAARYEYDPFGKTIFAEGQMAGENPYRFSTKYQDAETGLYYYGFRFYDVDLGRWINRDPIGTRGGSNINSFIDNDPANYVDMLGLTLYAFDGTGDNKFYGQYTHVGRLYEIYRFNKEYYAGIGSFFNGYSPFDIYNGITGDGAYDRVYRALNAFRRYQKSGNHEDKTVDIIGFSRGASIARLFAQKIYEDTMGCAKIRFVGLFDTVASFHGIDSDLNAPDALNLPITVEYAFHIIAENEKRNTFPVTRLNQDYDPSGAKKWDEIKLPGAHADIGGGYGDKNNLLAYESLSKMYGFAVNRAGVPFGPLGTTPDDFVQSKESHEPEKEWLPPFALFGTVDRLNGEGVLTPSPYKPMRPLTPDEMKAH